MRFAYHQAPPISVPFRFFATGLLFVTLATAAMTWQGTAMWMSRWSGVTVAVVHLFTLGFMLQIMCGALFQILPVVVGVSVPRAALLAGVMHPLLGAGTLLLSTGMWFAERVQLVTGAVCLFFGMLLFTTVTTTALLRNGEQRPTAVALLGLLVTALLGPLAVGALLGAPFNLLAVVKTHVGWALGVWAGALLVGIAGVVVPMFQITPPVPVAISRWLAPLLVLAAVFLSIGATAEWTAVETVGEALFAAATILFALTVLDLQRRRRRVRTDATVWYWRISMLSAVAFAALLLFARASGSHITLMLGVLALHGIFGAAMAGMLYKIVPLLSWLHLQERGIRAPRMERMIPARVQELQCVLHAIALAALLAASVEPAFGTVAAALSLSSYGALAWNVGAGMWRLGQLTAGTRAAAAGRG